MDGAEKLLAEIIFNLCDNAIKYNQENGHVAVSVSPEGDRVVLTVQDTGIGIPPGETDRVFERFYRWIRATPRRSAARPGPVHCQARCRLSRRQNSVG